MTHDPERGIYERCSGCGFEIGGDEFPIESQAGDFCRQCAGRKINELAEGQRWRKWPEEVPKNEGSAHPCQVVLYPIRGDTSELYPSQATYWLGRWLLDELRSDDDVTNRVKCWRPIGELPKAETEAGGADHG